jgi:putative ABC transport system permease protein
MSIRRHLRSGVRALFQRSTVDREIADEVQHYLEQSRAAHRARGLSEQEALRAARLELGSELSVREQVRTFGWENVVEALAVDARFAVRRLWHEPGFTAILVLTLALGLGCTAAIMGAVKPILFEPLPYPQSERISTIREVGSDGARVAGTFGMYRELSARTRSFEALAVHRSWQPALTGSGQPERIDGQRVSAGYLRVLGVTPALGRDIQLTDDRLNGPNVVLLSDGFWRRRLGADRAVIGRTIRLDDQPHVIIGVLPRNFENAALPSAELWAPLQYDLSQGRAWGHHLHTLGRLRSGVRLTEATLELNAIGAEVLAEVQPPTYDRELRFQLATLHDDVTRGVKPALLTILVAVSLLLGIACLNVINLLLARSAQRRSEFALRAALGAGHSRLIVQQLVEGLMLAALAGLLGLALAWFGVRALAALGPADLPRLHAIGIDRGVFALTLGITTLLGLSCGLIPAWQAARTDPQRALERGTHRIASGRGRTRRALVVAEVALALMLLVATGLLLRSMQRLFAIDPGFDPRNLVTAQVQVSGQRFSADTATYRFFARSLEAVRRVPGVSAAALTSQLPLSGDHDLYGVQFEPSPRNDPGEVKGTFRYAVSPDYLETMGVPLRRGRSLEEYDHENAPRVALISESLARRRLAGLEPIGQRLRIGTGPLYTVVGVVGDVRQVSLAQSELEAVYVTAAQWRFADNAMWLVVQSRGAPAAVLDAVRQAVWSVDKDQPVVRSTSLTSLLAASAAQRRFALILFECFALAALALAAAGVYGLLSGSVTERMRELGVRSALGATRTRLLALVIGQGMSLTGLGILIGLAGAAAASRVIIALLFNTSPLDPITYLVVVALIAIVGLCACGLPAWRAARVDPMRTLRL